MTVRKNLLSFIISRYLNYALLFVRGLILAKFLGPVNFGTWGFLTLLLQYFSYSTLGINYAVTVKLSTTEDVNDGNKSKVSSSAVIVSLFISLGIIVIALGIHFLKIPVFSKFDFNRFLVPTFLIVGFANVQQVLINIYRVKNGLFKIAVTETVSAILLIASAFLFHNNDLIVWQLRFMAFTGLISILILLLNPPIKIQYLLDKKIVKLLFRLGLPLLIYNFSFYLITISARTIINGFYSNEILGYYTLANSLSYAVLLGFQSAGWAIYPDVLSKTARRTNPQDSSEIINRINTIYSTACFLIVFLVVMFLPLLMLFLPAYKPAIPVITILIFAQAILSVSFGYNALAVARNKQNTVAKISIGVVILIVTFGLITCFLKMDFLWVAIITLVGSITYTVFQSVLGAKLLGYSEKRLRIISKIISPGFLIAMILVIVGSFTQYPIFWSIPATVIFIIFHYKNIKKLLTFVKEGLNI